VVVKREVELEGWYKANSISLRLHPAIFRLFGLSQLPFAPPKCCSVSAARLTTEARTDLLALCRRLSLFSRSAVRWLSSALWAIVYSREIVSLLGPESRLQLHHTGGLRDHCCRRLDSRTIDFTSMAMLSEGRGSWPQWYDWWSQCICIHPKKSAHMCCVLLFARYVPNVAKRSNDISICSLYIDDRSTTDLSSWKISNGYISATGHPIHFAFGSRVKCRRK